MCGVTQSWDVVGKSKWMSNVFVALPLVYTLTKWWLHFSYNCMVALCRLLEIHGKRNRPDPCRHFTSVPMANAWAQCNLGKKM